jgi:hypothetical protein
MLLWKKIIYRNFTANFNCLKTHNPEKISINEFHSRLYSCHCDCSIANNFKIWNHICCKNFQYIFTKFIFLICFIEMKYCKLNKNSLSLTKSLKNFCLQVHSQNFFQERCHIFFGQKLLLTRFEDYFVFACQWPLGNDIWICNFLTRNIFEKMYKYKKSKILFSKKCNRFDVARASFLSLHSKTLSKKQK